ncbi:MAG: HEPN domain-containing protein [Spirochaetota bacterium]
MLSLPAGRGKTLKAVLAKQRLEIPRTHDLLELLDLVLVLAPSVASLEPRLLSLNDFAVVVRYPSHVPLEEQDAIKAIAAVREARQALAALL